MSTPALASVAPAAAFAVNTGKPAPIEFSAALDPVMTKFVENAVRSDSCAEILACYGRLPPAVLAAGATIALAECRAAALLVLREHGLGTNEMMQASSHVSPSKVLEKASSDTIIAVLNLVIEIAPALQEQFDSDACELAFSRGMLPVLENVQARLGRCPHGYWQGTMADLAGKVDEATFCRIFDFWQKPGDEVCIETAIEEVSNWASYGCKQAVQLLLNFPRQLGHPFSPATLATVAAVYALKYKHFALLELIVTKYQLGDTNMYVWRLWSSDHRNVIEWGPIFATFTAAEAERAVNALKTAVTLHSSSAGPKPLIVRNFRYAGHAQATLDFLCHPPVVELLRQTELSKGVVEVVQTSCRALTKMSLTQFFAIYGSHVGFSPDASVAPDGTVVCSLICSGLPEVPAIFAQATRRHVCHLTPKYFENKGFELQATTFPADTSAMGVARAFTAFYSAVACDTISEIIVRAVTGILLRENSRFETFEALTELVRICPIADWNIKYIFHKLIDKNKKTGLELFIEYSPEVRDLISRPATIRGSMDFKAYAYKHEKYLSYAIRHEEPELFAMLLRAVSPSPEWLCFLLMKALSTSYGGCLRYPNSVRVCHEFGATLPRFPWTNNSMFEYFVNVTETRQGNKYVDYGKEYSLWEMLKKYRKTDQRARMSELAASTAATAAASNATVAATGKAAAATASNAAVAATGKAAATAASNATGKTAVAAAGTLKTAKKSTAETCMLL